MGFLPRCALLVFALKIERPTWSPTSASCIATDVSQLVFYERTEVDLHGRQVDVEMPALRWHSGSILPALCQQNDILPASCRQSACLDRQQIQLFEIQKSLRCLRGAQSYPLKQMKLCAVKSRLKSRVYQGCLRVLCRSDRKILRCLVK